MNVGIKSMPTDLPATGRSHQPERHQDFIYDPIRTVSGERKLKKLAQSAKIKRVTDFENMFSALPHYPTHSLRFVLSAPPTRSKSRTIDISPAAPKDTRPTRSKPVSGGSWSRFFKQPANSLMTRISPALQVAPETLEKLISKDDEKGTTEEEVANEPKQKTKGIQTDYRESETQTHPYTPPFKILFGETPEVLSLAPLTWGKGLPVTEENLEFVRKLKEKHSILESMACAADVAELQKLKNKLKEQERLLWESKHGEIQRKQTDHMNNLKTSEKKTEKQNAKVVRERVERLKKEKEKEKEEAMVKIRRNEEKNLQRLKRQYEARESRIRAIFREDDHAPAPTRRKIKSATITAKDFEQKPKGAFTDLFTSFKYIDATGGFKKVEKETEIETLEQPESEETMFFGGDVGYIKRKNKLNKVLFDLHQTIRG